MLSAVISRTLNGSAANRPNAVKTMEKNIEKQGKNLKAHFMVRTEFENAGEEKPLLNTSCRSNARPHLVTVAQVGSDVIGGSL